MKPFPVLMLLLAVGCSTAENPMTDQSEAPGGATFTAKGHTTDSLAEVKEKVGGQQAVLIDVREQGEWDSGHLADATLIPMSQFNADGLTDELKQQLPTDKPIYLHCAAGGRVLKVAEILKPAGYDVRPLQAGYSELVEQGFPKAE